MLAAGFLLIVLTASVPETETEGGPKPVEVQFDGPAGCSTAKAFLASLRSRTTQVRTAEGDEARTRLQVRLTRDRARVVGELRIVDDSGATDTRKVQGASCEDVVQALSLTAALALDPTATLSVSPEVPGADEPVAGSAPTASPQTEPATEKKPALPEKKAPEPITEAPALPTMPPSAPDRAVPGFELGAQSLGLMLLTDELSPGFALDAHKNLGSGRIVRPALGVALLYARNDVLRSPEKAAVALIAGAGSLCPVRVDTTVLSVQPCAALWGGMLGGAGRQLTRERRVNHVWLSAGLTLRLLAYLGHGLALQAEGGFQSPFFKRRYFATIPSNVIAETPTISPVVGLGLTYGF